MTFAHSAAALSVLVLSAAGATWPLGSSPLPQEIESKGGLLTPAELQEHMVRATTGFLGRLDEARKAEASASWDDPERRTWAFGPVQREGLAIGSLAEEDLAALETLLATALSTEGLAAWHEIRELENVLRKLESTPERIATHRDPDLYWLRVYGTPALGERWSWRFEGHHVALHVSCRPDEYPTVTPFFLGASPLFTEDGAEEQKKIRVGLFQELSSELNELVSSLDEAESTGSAGKPAERPRDVRMGPGKFDLPKGSGLHWPRLSEPVRGNLTALLDVYLACLRPELRRFSLDAKERDDQPTRFQRWGGTEIDEARTWAIVTPTFALELATTDGPHHVHIVLRDIERDFGGK